MMRRAPADCQRGRWRVKFVCKMPAASATHLLVTEDADLPPAASDAITAPPSRGADAAVDWGAALARHGRWLRRLIHARVGEPQAVDEVMQEVSLAAVAHPPAGTAAGQVAAWLYRVAVRQTLLYRRRSGRRRKLLDRFARGNPPPADDADRPGALTAPGAPLGWLLSAERGELVRQAVARLPRKEADVLLLKYAEGWTYRQIAAHLGDTESAVEARLHRARARLRAELIRLKLNDEDVP